MVGHDWGAAVAWTMAGLDPKRLTSATMIQAPHPAVWLQAMRADPHLRAGLNVAHGKVTFEAVAQALGYACTAPDALLS